MRRHPATARTQSLEWLWGRGLASDARTPENDAPDEGHEEIFVRYLRFCFCYIHPRAGEYPASDVRSFDPFGDILDVLV